jgi:hypothetical protein
VTTTTTSNLNPTAPPSTPPHFRARIFTTYSPATPFTRFTVNRSVA